MSVVSRLLKWCGVFTKATDDDRLNAEIQNDLFDHRGAVRSAKEAIMGKRWVNKRLHNVLQESQSRSQEFAKFEALIRKETTRVRGDL